MTFKSSKKQRLQADYLTVIFDAPVKSFFLKIPATPLKRNLRFSSTNCGECNRYQILAEDHGRQPVGESVPLKQMKEIV
jgi:hypothetical protein